jgi:dTDP-4-amino-4,6-dideoxygalactose transaminase
MIPIARPIISEEEKQAVLAVLESGQLAQGEKVAEFEREFAAFCGARYAVATSSGTTALHTALLAHGIGPGDEVITTPFTFIASANAILFTGARPVFVDIEPETFNIDPNRVEEAVRERKRKGARLKAILPVHLFGHPCDIEAIMEIARRYDLLVIEDACQAHGASVNGKKSRNFRDRMLLLLPYQEHYDRRGGHHPHR